MKVNVKLLVFSIALPLLVGAIGSAFTTSEITIWYTTLNKPSFNPPNFVFAPAWTTLYILTGISFYLVLTSKVKDKVLAAKFFVAQLLLNTLWSLIFFGAHNPLLAFLEIIILWSAVLLTIVSFTKSQNRQHIFLSHTSSG